MLTHFIHCQQNLLFCQQTLPTKTTGIKGGSKLQCIKSDLQHTQNQSISTQNQPHSVPMAIAAKVLVLLFFVLALAFLVEQTTAQWYGYPYYYGKREAGFMPQGAANGNAEGSAAGGGHAMFKF
uniref:Uncharacterized protein n=1 Tax=Globodera rostochiensis TaxID=31243 RepID=A0A914GX78_GLORO